MIKELIKHDQALAGEQIVDMGKDGCFETKNLSIKAGVTFTRHSARGERHILRGDDSSENTLDLKPIAVQVSGGDFKLMEVVSD